MKQYYEAEVLFQLMEREGFNIPSSVPKYESEIKAYLINQVKQAYPKLTDYEAEWLLYNYTKHLPAEFPISSVSNVTEAIFENVVPFAYQSAILKGQTLVNLIGDKHEYDTAGTKLLCGWEFMLPYNLTSGKTYLAIFDVSGTIDTSNAKVYLMDNGFDSTTGNVESTIPSFSLGHNVVKCIATNNNHRVLRIRTTYNEPKFTVSNVMFIEYQEGMENWDIPYFEGMQSVKMPVLKTTGKNLFNKNDVEFNYAVGNTNPANNEHVSSNFIAVRPSTQYTVNDSLSVVVGFDINKKMIDKIRDYDTSGTFTTPFNCYFIRIRNYNPSTDQQSLIDNAQVEIGSSATEYEPYKSNILTVNEDVTLRGIGDVQDTLDLLTGELTQRIGEIVLDGVSIIPTVNRMENQNNTIAFDFKESFSSLDPSPIHSLNDTFPDYSGNYLYANDVEGVARGWTAISVRINKNRLTQANVEGFKEWLQSNPITVQYPLATESVKTVDLTTVNENGETTHFMPLEGTMNVQSSGEIIQPTFDMSVPVEATTQNLASFIELEMEE